MMLWAKNSYKSVTFTPEVADQTLLAVIETELAKQPHKTFSDLCKEALWQFLCVPESVRPNPKPGQMEQQLAELLTKLSLMDSSFPAPEPIRLESLETPLRQVAQQSGQMLDIVAQLQGKFAELERRVTAAESSRTEQVQTQLTKLNEKLQQLLEMKVALPQLAPEPAPAPAPAPETPSEPPPPSDPLLSRLSQFLDDF